MNWKKSLLYRSKLYFILDTDTIVNPPLYIVRKILNNNICDILQLRDKTNPKIKILNLARSIKRILRKSKLIFIINDHIDIAKAIDADGVHLGQNDLPLTLARKILGRNKIIGISCHSLKEAKESEKLGADYISIGPIFPTPLKPCCQNLGINILKKISKQISIPYFAIGGIDFSNIDDLLAIGVKRIAFSRLLGKARDLDFTIEQLNKKFYIKT